LAMTFRKAGTAMLVTSASTALSFFANLVSSLPVIKEFGLFMGLVVCVNYILVLVYFPTLVIISSSLFSCCKSKKEGVGVAAPTRTRAASMDLTGAAEASEETAQLALAEPQMTPREAAGPGASLIDPTAATSGDGPRGTSAPAVAPRFSGSLRDILGGAGTHLREARTVNYSDPNFKLQTADGWGLVDVFLHNHFAPAIYNYRRLILAVTVSFLAFGSIDTSIRIKPASKPPNFFNSQHNLGMLELINTEYVISPNFSVDIADAASWGVLPSDIIDPDLINLPSEYCPSTSGQVCSGKGACNSISFLCLCFVGWQGADCSTPVDLSTGNLVPSSTKWSYSSYTLGSNPHEFTFTLSNTGETKLNWYFFALNDVGADIYFEENPDKIPSWVSLSKFSGSVKGGATSDVVTVTVDSGDLSEGCEGITCEGYFGKLLQNTVK